MIKQYKFGNCISKESYNYMLPDEMTI